MVGKRQTRSKTKRQKEAAAHEQAVPSRTKTAVDAPERRKTRNPKTGGKKAKPTEYCANATALYPQDVPLPASPVVLPQAVPLPLSPVLDVPLPDSPVMEPQEIPPAVQPLYPPFIKATEACADAVGLYPQDVPLPLSPVLEPQRSPRLIFISSLY